MKPRQRSWRTERHYFGSLYTNLVIFLSFLSREFFFVPTPRLVQSPVTLHHNIALYHWIPLCLPFLLGHCPQLTTNRREVKQHTAECTTREGTPFPLKLGVQRAKIDVAQQCMDDGGRPQEVG